MAFFHCPSYKDMGVVLSDLIMDKNPTVDGGENSTYQPTCSEPSVLVPGPCRWCENRSIHVQMAKTYLTPWDPRFSLWKVAGDLRTLLWHWTHPLPKRPQECEILFLISMKSVQELLDTHETFGPYDIVRPCPTCGLTDTCQDILAHRIVRRFQKEDKE